MPRTPPVMAETEEIAGAVPEDRPRFRRRLRRDLLSLAPLIVAALVLEHWWTAPLRVGRVYSIAMLPGNDEIPTVDWYGLLKVVSDEGEGCCLLYRDDLTARPRTLPPLGPVRGNVTLEKARKGARFWQATPLGRSAVTTEERAACRGPTDRDLADMRRCRTPVRAGVELSVSEACRLDLLRARCRGLDPCLAHCIATGGADLGQGYAVAGGCDHVCGIGREYRGQKWRPPDGWDGCGR